MTCTPVALVRIRKQPQLVFDKPYQQKMKVRGDADAQRMHVLTTAEEMKYFDAVDV